MADAPSGSGSGAPPPKAIGSLAKKQSDVTRQGTSKLKFVPTLPQRRKKEEVKSEPTPAVIPAATEGRGRGRGRGAGRGDGARGRGRGRGGPPEVVMTASGPFAMGPAMAGSTGSRRSTPRSNFAPSVAPSLSGSSSLGTGLSHTAPPSLKKDLDLKGKGREVKQEDEEEVYSDADEGVEIIDMENVRSMDWMAPESLRKERPPAKKVKKEKKDLDTPGEIDVANALDLSESEEEEEEPELEDVIEDFATQVNIDSEDASLREERLYLFQFPTPFPTFLPNPKPSEGELPAEDGDVEMGDATKKVSFGPDVKPPADEKPTPATSRTASTAPSDAPKPEEPLDGVVGRLEVYRSGAVKIRLGDDIVLDVTPATQPSFLQQAVYIDRTDKRLAVLGEVNKQFVVAPDVDALLRALDEADNKATGPTIEGEEELIKM
ncbi:hypothetical protein D9611_006268 [Ephemerocybe angulata]|uniref:DNA-directed RNA polymerase III subunit RPC4 n=1 Tax=Ephemerocybe angulata TaxID=980116 RepID=A0A8H5C6S1_9AGAR|nr:hypothetical protein D9611_006268 [Tulosesus angulatus]